jgi:uncharacterized protein VirK/YbjX
MILDSMAKDLLIGDVIIGQGGSRLTLTRKSDVDEEGDITLSLRDKHNAPQQWEGPARTCMKVDV